MGVRVLNVLASSQKRGAETFAYELHQELTQRGVSSAAVSLIPGGVGQLLPVPALGTRRYSPTVLAALRRQVAEAAVVVGHGSSTLLACGVATFGLCVPFVYVNIGDPRHWASTPARRIRVSWLMRRTSAVAAISPRSTDLLIRKYGLPPERVHVVPNGRSAELFRPASDEKRLVARATLGLPATGVVAASIGALSREKRIDVAIRSLAGLPHTTLVVAGDGPERAKLEELADATVHGRVRFVGVRPVTELLAAVDVLILSSDSEGVPGILIEAGLAGVPAVASDVGFVRDVVVPGETGELVPPGRPREIAAAVERVLIDRERYAAKARAHCLAHFEIGAVVDRWEELLNAVIVAAAQSHRRGAG